MSAEVFLKFEPFTRDDIEAFFGFNMLMGINSLPTLHMYWENSSWYKSNLITDRISRDRFEEISRYLHFADNDSLFPLSSQQYDRLGKVRPLLDHLSHKFRAMYNPGENLSVDEAMIKFQGRSTLKQYMPKKPVKRGIKVWVIADDHGYFSQLQVYTGKRASVKHTLGERVVKDLTSTFTGCWHRVFFDSFFTTRKLLCDLESQQIYGCGTARKDKSGFPTELKNVKMKIRYVYIYHYCNL